MLISYICSGLTDSLELLTILLFHMIWNTSTKLQLQISVLQDIFESMGQFVDGLKFSGGSHSLMSKDFIKEVTNMAHQHDIYVSTGDWAEHLLRRGPSAFREYVEVRCARGSIFISYLSFNVYYGSYSCPAMITLGMQEPGV